MSKFFTPHALERAKERYGLDLTSQDMAQILIAVREGKGVHLSNIGRGLTFSVQFKGRTMFVVTDLARETIITFRPADMLFASQAKKWRQSKPKPPTRAKKGRKTHDYKQRVLADSLDGGAE